MSLKPQLGTLLLSIAMIGVIFGLMFWSLTERLSVDLASSQPSGVILQNEESDSDGEDEEDSVAQLEEVFTPITTPITTNGVKGWPYSL